jgi:hypothetical protein
VANDGTIEFRKGERTFFTYLLQRKQINDIVKLDILRKGEKDSIVFKLTKVIDYERVVPHRQFDTAPTYYIIGGLVFETLTLNYLMEFGGGGNWYVTAPTELLNYYLNGEPEQDRRELVILVKVLADEINIGYHNSQNVVVSSVNGKNISSVRDLVAAFEQYEGEYHVIEDVRGYKIVLTKMSVDEHSAKILKKYKITSDRSDDLK